MKILIAEDTPILQELASELMNQWGYDFDLASNGQEAVNLIKIKEKRYDICLMDIDMPIMDGYEATRIIRRKTKYFPIIALTANEHIKKSYSDIGIDDYLKKPYKFNRLYDKLKELTVKMGKVSINNKKILIKKETPMDEKQLKELRDLDKKGLALLIVEGGQQKFIVHKNIQNKMSHILIGEGKELFEFLDRGDNPANCHLYKCHMQTNKLLLTPEQFKERIKTEDKDIKKYTTIADKKDSTENKDN